MRTAFSTWQTLKEAKTKNPKNMRKAYVQACVHMEFVVRLYHEQLFGNRYFLYEHPGYASSWEPGCMKKLQCITMVQKVHGEQCQYGAEGHHRPHEGWPVKKPIGLISNAPELLWALSKRCTGFGTQCSRVKGGNHSARRRHLQGDFLIPSRSVPNRAARIGKPAQG